MAVDWVTASSLATAGGTLVLAVATFASVRSSNRSSRLAEQSLLANIRPLLMPSKPEDPAQKVGFADNKWLMTPPAGGATEIGDDVVYLTLSLRNAGQGIAVLHGWHFVPFREMGDVVRPSVEDFRRLTRDLYIPPGDIGFWQGAFRDPSEPAFDDARKAIESRETITIDLLYGDHQGGQRVITRFAMIPRQDGSWYAIVGRHWNVDRPDPR